MPKKKKEIYTYEAPWPVYAMGWSDRTDDAYKFRFAVGSFREEYTNQVSVVQYNPESDAYERTAGFEHPYPPTKLSWIPDANSAHQDLIATSGDYLRVWRVEPNNPEVALACTLNTSKSRDYCAPLTSLDWNPTDLNVVGTSSIDTTCTVWDVTAQKVIAQLIAHDEEVYDMAFASRERNLFASASADGSVRVFDLRQLDRSTIVFESDAGARKALLRVSWNKQDSNFLAVVSLDSNKTVVLDKRCPGRAFAELGGHSGAVNAAAWAPHSSRHLCTAGEDAQALIWELATLPREIDEPILTYRAAGCVNQLQWSAATPNWVGIAFDDKVQALRV